MAFGAITIGSLALKAAQLFLGSDGVIAKGFDLAAKKSDVDLQKTVTLTGAQKEVLIEALRGDTRRTEIQGSLVMAAMTHPVWWWAWGLFVFPVGFYHAAIFLSSTIPYLNGWTVLRVPATQEAWALSIIQTIFVAQVGTGIAGGVVDAVKTIFKK